MKQLMILLLMGILLYSNVVHATEPKVTDQMVTRFHNKFPDASKILWSQSGEFIRAEFLMEGKYKVAYFNSESELVVTVTPVLKESLPTPLLSSLQKKWAESSISRIIMTESQTGTSYYCFIDEPKKTIILVSGKKKWHYLTYPMVINEW
jgi:hypothetical protein